MCVEKVVGRWRNKPKPDHTHKEEIPWKDSNPLTPVTLSSPSVLLALPGHGDHHLHQHCLLLGLLRVAAVVPLRLLFLQAVLPLQAIRLPALLPLLALLLAAVLPASGGEPTAPLLLRFH